MPTLGKKVASQIASMAALAPVQSMQNMAREAAKWERRAVIWELENPSPIEFYDRVLELYIKLGDSLIVKGRDPLTAMLTTKPVSSGIYRSHWLTLKEVIEDLIGRKLPDIKPSDAIELARVSPFPAEIWWRGCTDRSRWKYADV